MADVEQRAAKRKRYTSRIITIKVGAAKEEITVQEAVLQEDSPFFKAALEKKWKEGNAAEIELPDDEFDVVCAYVHWLYRDEIIDPVESRSFPGFILLVKMYIFGDKVQSKKFCRAATFAILKALDTRDKDGVKRHPSFEPDKCV